MTTQERAVELLLADADMDFDGPCWCNKRNAGPWESLGHSKACNAKKEWFADRQTVSES